MGGSALKAEEEMTDLSDMTASELEEVLSSLQAELEDFEEERAFVLGQTGVHISASTVSRYESERTALKAKIAAVEDALRIRGAGQA
jgi:hypothetical protein